MALPFNNDYRIRYHNTNYCCTIIIIIIIIIDIIITDICIIRHLQIIYIYLYMMQTII